MSKPSLVLDSFSQKQLVRINMLLDIKETRIRFAKDHHVTTDGSRMDFENANYMKALYNSLSPEIVVIGGTQCFKSEWLLIDHLAAAYNGLSVLFVLRNHEANKTYVQNRIDATIDSVPYYRNLMKGALFNHVNLKRFSKGRIKYCGSNVPGDFLEFPGCLDSDTIVQLGDGKSEKPIKQCKTGDRILARDQDGVLVIDTILHNVCTGNKPVFRITTESGKFVDATLQHRFLTSKGWRRVYQFVQPQTSIRHSDGSVEPNWEYVYSSSYGDIDGRGINNTSTKNLFLEGVCLETADGTDPVVSVTYLGIRETWDIETEVHHNFMAGGIVSHNSMICVDELNECNWNNIKIGFSRLDASPYKFKRFVGNSKSKESPLELLYEASNRQRYHAPCLSCGKTTWLDWFQLAVSAVQDAQGNVVDFILKDREWYPGSGRDIHLVCPNCGGVVDRLSKSGVWLAENHESIVEGFHIPSLCSPMVTVAELWKEFRDGINDPKDMQLFYFRRLAVPYNAIGGQVTGHLLDKCRGVYEMVIHPDRAFISGDSCDGPCSMGIDMSPSSMDVRISEVLSGNRRRAVFVAKINTENISELHDLIHRYNVQKCVMDIQPEQALAQQFQEEAACDVWLAKLGRKTDSSDPLSENSIRRIINAQKTYLMDRSYAQIQTGRNILPSNYELILNGEYVQEMCMPVREIGEDAQGNPTFEWSKGKDHQRLADVYDYLAWKMLNDDTVVITSDCVYYKKRT